jgi:hypothetical protein
VYASDSTTHSFIIRIWREADREFAWRGHITHVPSGKKQYFDDMEGISTFILSYLEMIDVKLSMYQRLKQWLKRWKLKV